MVPTIDGRGAVAVGGIDYGPGAWIIEPGTPTEVVEPTPTLEPTPEPTPVPTRRPTPRPTPVPTAAPAANTAAERYLINGLPPRVRGTCVPNRDDLPEGTVAAILCEPDVAGVERVGYYLMTTRDANAVIRERQDEYLGPNPRGVCPGIVDEAGWAGYGICYVDEQGRPNLRFIEFEDDFCHPDPVTLGGTVVRKPTVYTGVVGTGRLMPLLTAWLGSRIQWNYPDGTNPPDQGDSTGGVNCGVPWPTSGATPRPTAAPAANTAAERYLINGLPRRVRDTCEPNRDDLPEGTVAAILCQPDVSGVERVGYYLMTTRDANAVIRERRDEYLGPRPDFGCPGIFDEAGWAEPASATWTSRVARTCASSSSRTTSAIPTRSRSAVRSSASRPCTPGSWAGAASSRCTSRGWTRASAGTTRTARTSPTRATPRVA